MLRVRAALLLRPRPETGSDHAGEVERDGGGVVVGVYKVVLFVCGAGRRLGGGRVCRAWGWFCRPLFFEHFVSRVGVMYIHN